MKYKIVPVDVQEHIGHEAQPLKLQSQYKIDNQSTYKNQMSHLISYPYII